MSKYVTLSVKIPRDMRERLEKLGISTSKVMRRALLEAIREAELRKLEQELESLAPVLEKLTVEHVASNIRENRDQR